MTSRLVMTKKDPRRTDFVLLADASRTVDAHSLTYTADTTRYPRPHGGRRATTTITRTDPTGDRLQVGVIEWPVLPHNPVQLVVGTRSVQMTKFSALASSERFAATDGFLYEWQIRDSRPQLVPLRGYNRASPSYVATFVQSHSGFCLWRKHTSSLFVPPEGFHILDDIVVTFIYFESKWRDKEGARSRSSLSGGFM